MRFKCFRGDERRVSERFISLSPFHCLWSYYNWFHHNLDISVALAIKISSLLPAHDLCEAPMVSAPQPLPLISERWSRELKDRGVLREFERVWNTEKFERIEVLYELIRARKEKDESSLIESERDWWVVWGVYSCHVWNMQKNLYYLYEIQLWCMDATLIDRHNLINHIQKI